MRLVLDSVAAIDANHVELASINRWWKRYHRIHDVNRLPQPLDMNVFLDSKAKELLLLLCQMNRPVHEPFHSAAIDGSVLWAGSNDRADGSRLSP